jgi:hypothetical protein
MKAGAPSFAVFAKGGKAVRSYPSALKGHDFSRAVNAKTEECTFASTPHRIPIFRKRPGAPFAHDPISTTDRYNASHSSAFTSMLNLS